MVFRYRRPSIVPPTRRVKHVRDRACVAKSSGRYPTDRRVVISLWYVDLTMEELMIRIELPWRPSKNVSLTPSSAWIAVSKPFQSRPNLSAGVMSCWVEQQNGEVFSQHKRIFYVPGLTSRASSSEAKYTQLPNSGKWKFKGIPVLTVNTDMPPTVSELDLRTEMDFWETVVPDKSARPRETETPAAPEQPDVLFDANEEPKQEDEEGLDDGRTHTNEPDTVSPRPLSPAAAHPAGGINHSVTERQTVFQPQTTLNPHLSRAQFNAISYQ